MMRWLVLALLVGCGPTVIWSGHTGDRRRRVEVIEDAGLQYVVVDGVRRGAYAGIAGWSIAFSDAHLAFAARVGRHWTVVRDGHPGPLWDGVGEIVLSPSGRLAYAAQRDGRWRAVIDGAEGPGFDAILAGTFQFEGTHVAYVGRAGGGVRAVIDGRDQATFDGIGHLAFAPGGAHVAYAARRGTDAYVVIDGQLGKRWAAVAKLVVGTNGRVAYAASDGPRWHVVVDGGEPGPAVDRVREIVMRDDGAHVAWLEQLGATDVVELDGTPVGAWPRRAMALAFRPAASSADGVGLAYVAPAAAGGVQVVVDGVGGPAYDEIAALAWSRTGRLGYAARRGRTWLASVDDHELPGGEHVGSVVFSPDGRRAGYVARRARAAYVEIDGDLAQRFDLAFEDTLVFSSDSRHWAVIAGDLAHEELFIATDRGARVPIPKHELYSAGAHTAREDDVLRAWARAEVDRR